MKNFGKMILYISLAVAAFLFALNGRYQVSSAGQGGLTMWTKYDTVTGRAWQASYVDSEIHWIEIQDYGYVFTKVEKENS